MADAVVSRHAGVSVLRGHPWLFRGAIVRAPSATMAAPVRVVDETGRPLGCGIFDPTSPIAIRIWDLDPSRTVDAGMFRDRLARALEVRRVLFAGSDTTAYRLLNGEGDRAPAFVIDRYGDVAVLKIDGEGARELSAQLTTSIEPLLRAHGVTTLLERDARRGEDKTVRVRFGPPRERITVREHGVPFEVDLLKGQKTGAFLDQRENRRRIGELVAMLKRSQPVVKVLNLFSYTGGFSLRAALAGGVVTSVDIAASAHKTAQDSFRLAGVDTGPHTFAAADAFAFLESAKRRGESWDVVISDPPSFAPSEKAKPKALSAYRSLHRACADVLAPGGTFVAASCSSHVTAEDFLATLDDAAVGGRALSLLELFGPPPDHPSLAVFPEGRYLKLAVLR